MADRTATYSSYKYMSLKTHSKEIKDEDICSDQEKLNKIKERKNKQKKDFPH